MPSPAAERTERRVAIALLLGLGLAFLVVCAADLSAPFGHSDEGINAAVWGDGSRALRQLGPIESKLGGVRVDGRLYATHPPGILVETALTETVLGEHRWSTRAPAWLGALATIPLLYLLLRAIRLRPTVAAGAVVAGLGTPMFFTYGWMLDTPVTALPFGVATAVVWQRARASGSLTVAAPAALAVLVGLSGWQASLFVGLLGLWNLVDPPGGRRARAAAPYLAGVAAGLAASVGFGLWVYGGLDALRDKLLLRSAGESSGLADLLAYQGRWTTLLLGVGLIGLVACVVALRDQRFRPLAAVSLLAVFGYMLVFRGAAASHPFWNYWVLLPTTIGYGYAFDRARAADPARARVVVPVAAVVLAVVGVALPGAAKQNIRAGTEAVRSLVASPPSSTQTELPYVGDLVQPEDWMWYELGVRGRPIDDTDELERWALDHPDAALLVAGPCPPDDAACALLWPMGLGAGDYRVVRGDQAASALAGR